MRKVLFVIERFCQGGAERALSNIVTHFPSGWHIDILVDDESLIGYPYQGNIVSLSLPEKYSTIHYIKSMIIRTLYLKRIKKENRYDACISFMEGANMSNVLSGNRYCKTIVSIRVMLGQSGLYGKVRGFLLTGMLFRQADTITAVSKETALQLTDRLKIPACKVRAIINGYDCEWIRDQSRRYPSNSKIEKDFFKKNTKVIITAGRIVRQKGQWHLIRAFSDVVKREPEAKLVILGEGLLEGYLTELIHGYALEESVVLAGRSENPFWYYASASVFVLPSLWEGYPNALAEAVCCGVPCIAADVHSGPREILAPALDVAGERVKDVSEEEYGILVPVCSGSMYKNGEPLTWEEKKMAEAIVTLLRDDGKREHYRKKCAERGKDLDINRIVAQWIDVITEKTQSGGTMM